jgi:hypothetical protein
MNRDGLSGHGRITFSSESECRADARNGAMLRVVVMNQEMK